MHSRRSVCLLLPLAVWLASSLRAAPTITTQPAQANVTVGQPMSFTVAATGTGNLTYQWQRNGFNITSATAATYTIASASRTDADYYNCVVTDGSGSTTSSTARLGVAPTGYPALVAPDPAWALQTETGAGGRVVAPLGDGRYYVGGSISSANGSRQTGLFRANADGTLDTTFVPPEIDNSVNAIAVQSDGKVLVGGGFYRVNNVVRPFLIRLNSDGSIDASFAATANASVNAILIQPGDGRILIGGSFSTVNTFGRFGVARLNTDGTLDLVFNAGSSGTGSVNALALQPDGRVVIGGTITNLGGTAISRIVRLTSFGTIDTTFAVGTGADNTINALAIDAGGNVLLGGDLATFNSAAVGRVARVSSTGAIDSTFNPGGAGFNSTVRAFWLQGTNVLVGGDFTTFNGATCNFLGRLTSAGTLDNTFTPAAPSSGVFAVALQSDGHYLIAGNWGTVGGVSGRNGYARLNSNGTLDTSVSIIVRNTSPGAAAILPLANGQVIVAGNFQLIRGASVPAYIARINSDGTRDATFNSAGVASVSVTSGGSGYLSVPSVTFTGGGGSGATGIATVSGGVVTGVTIISAGAGYTSTPSVTFGGGGGAGAIGTVSLTNVSGANSPINAAALLPDGRIAIAGTFTTYNGVARNRIAVLNANGSLDTSFNPSAGGLNGTANALVVLSGGRLFVGGSFTSANGTAINRVAVFKADGTLDTTFAPGTGASATVNAAVAQADGKIVIVGNTGTYNGTTTGGIARILATGGIDTTFNSGGAGANSTVNTVALRADGGIVIGGNFSSYNGTSRNNCALLTGTGALDTSFVPTGTGTINGLLVQEDNKVIVRGSFLQVGGVATAILRFNTDGSRDTTFIGAGISAPGNGTSNAAVVMRDNGQLFFSNVPTGFAATQPVASAAPTISAQPANQIASVGGNPTFSVTGSSIAPLSYQWQFNGLAIPGATNASLTVVNARLDDAGSYRVVVSSEFGSITSSVATLTGANAAPTITTQPQSTAIVVGQSGSLSVSATGTGTLSYQWRKFGSPIPGATAATLSLSTTTLADAGLYDVLVGDGLSVTVSSPVRVTINPPGYATGALRPKPGFAPRIEAAQAGANAIAVDLATGKFYVAGELTRVNGVVRLNLARFNADGSFDSTWAPAALSGNGDVHTLVLQPDGKLILGGQFTLVGGVSRNRIARLNTDGTLDTTFNPGTASNGNVYALALQGDGKVVVGGGFTSFNGTSINRLVRLNIDGSIDASLAIGTGFASDVRALALQSDGKIIAGGLFTSFNGVAANATRLARLSSAGALDPTFATGTGCNNDVRSLALQADGKVVVGGLFTSYNGNTTTATRLVRVGTDGVQDATFVTGSGCNNSVLALALQSDGKVIAVGDFTSYNGTSINRIARINGAGTLDSSASFTVGSGLSGTVSALALQTDGAIIAGGFFGTYNGTARAGLVRLSSAGAIDASLAPDIRRPGSVVALEPLANGQWLIGGFFHYIDDVRRNCIARMNADGTLDATFLAAGTLFDNVVNAITVQGDGRVVAGGGFGSYNGVSRSGAARLNADGSLDFSFSPGTGGATVNVFQLQPDGRVIIGGTFTSFNGTSRNRVARLNIDGSLDTGFDPGTGFNNTVNALALQLDGKVVVGGTFSTFNGTTTNDLTRLTAAGALDTTFNSGGSGVTNTVNALLLQPDGKILASGAFTQYNGTTRNRIARINADGTLDAFSTTTGFNNTVTALALQSDAKIVGGGFFSTVNGTAQFVFGRVNADASLDANFNVPTALSAPYANVNVLRFAADGTLLIGATRIDYSDTTPGGGTFTLLEPAPAPVIAAQPSNQVANAGGSVTFSVTATGASLQYQWLKNGVAIASATSASYTINSVQLADVANYAVTITNLYGSLTSNAVTITAGNAAPTITVQPQNTLATAGQPASVSVTATGGGTLAYQWRRSGLPIAGATAATLSLASASRTDADYYDVIVNDGLAATTSQLARLAVAPSSYPQGLQLDTTFQPLIEANSSATVNRVTIGADGKIYAVGDFRSINGQPRSRVARYNADGSFDPTFNPGPVATAPLFALAVQADGKVLVGGPLGTLPGTDTRRLIRLTSTGALDTTFNAAGRGITGGNVNQIVVQPDGKIIAVGSFIFVNDVGRNRIVRLNPTDGSIDNTFFADVSGAINALVLQSDGRILIGGSFTTVDGVSRNRIARLNADGTLDTSFNPGTGADNSVLTISLATDATNAGKIVIGGNFANYNGNATNRIARLTSTGAFDNTLVIGAGANNSVASLICQPDGAILVSGTFSTYNGGTTSSGVAVARLLRLTSTGAVDTTFNVGSSGLNSVVNQIALQSDGGVVVGGGYSTINGVAHAPIARFSNTGVLDSGLNPSVVAYATIAAVATQPGANGKFLVAGNFFQLGGVPRFNLARFNADGSLDSAYNPGGTAATSINNSITSLAVRGDGKALITGSFTAIGGTTINRIARLNADGTLDSTFAPGSGSNNTPAFVVLQPDGRIFLGGTSSFTYNGVLRNGVARLSADGALDTTFVPGTFNSSLVAAAAQLDGKVLVGGNFTTLNGSAQTNLARLNADGTLDSTFAVATLNNAVNAIVIQPDGKILVGGAFTSYGADTRTRVMRLNTNGTLDTTFNANSSAPTGTVTGIILQENGKVIVRGTFTTAADGAPNSATAIRYNADGTRDSTFAAAVLPPNIMNAAIVLDDGSMVVAGGDNAFVNWDLMHPSIARLVAGQPLSITSQPQSVAVNSGDPVSFSVGATGTAPLTYRWLKNGNPLFGATNATLSILGADPTGMDPDDVGATYSVQVSNAFGTVTSNSATLTVNFAPMLWTMAPNQTVDPNGTITLTGFADGNPHPISYQWKKDGVAIPGATNATYTISSAQAGDAGTYTVVATNSVGSSVSDRNAPLVGSWVFTNAFAAQSTGVLTFLDDGRYLLAEDGDSTADPSGQDGMERGLYTWNPATGAFSVKLVNQTDGGWGLSAFGAGATISVSGDTLTLTNGSTVVTMSRVLPSATNPLIGAWFFDDPGTAATFLEDGRYFITQDGDPEDDNSGHPGMERGTYTWDPVNRALTVTSIVVDTDGQWGLSDSLGGPFYPKILNDLMLLGDATGFRVKPTQTVVTVSAKPVIAAAPISTSSVVGGNTTLSVTASGTGPFTYQWRKNGVAIASATNSSLALTNVATTDFGRYDVIVSNGAGSTTSAIALVAPASTTFDPTFIPPVFANGQHGSLMTVLSDGSILESNNALDPTLLRTRSGSVVRYLPDGTRDLTFDVNFPADLGLGFALAPTSDGKFYGSFLLKRWPGANARGRIARFNANGTLDTTFVPYDYGNIGSSTTGGSNVRKILLLANGQVLVSGFFTDFNGTGRAGIVRFNSDGTLDTTFAVTTMTGGTGVWSTPVIQPDGKIIIAGDFSSFNGVTVPGVARLNADGTTDPAFVPYGFSRASGGSTRGAVLQSTGKIVLGGRFTVGGITNIPFVRLNPNGAWDATFKLADPITHDGAAVNIRAMAPLADDKFVGADFSVYVCNADGSFDATFAQPALTNLSTEASADVFGIAPISGGYVVSGVFDLVNGLAKPNLMKLDTTGAVQSFTAELWGAQVMPVTFARTNSGRVFAAVTSAQTPKGLAELMPDGSFATAPLGTAFSNVSNVSSVYSLPDGRLFALVTNAATGAAEFRRFLSDGSLDPSLSTITAPTSPYVMDRALVSADGSAYLWGNSLTDGGSNLVGKSFATQAIVNGSETILRINANGSVDSSFNVTLPSPASTVTRNSSNVITRAEGLGIQPLAVDASGRLYVRYRVTGGLVRLIRLNAGGSVDTSFATVTVPEMTDFATLSATITDPLDSSAAPRTITFNLPRQGEFREPAIQPDGKIVVIGHFSALTINGTDTAAPGIARLNPDGTFDATFAIGAGAQWTSLTSVPPNYVPAVEAIVQQGDGKLLLAGNFESFDGASAPGFVRVNANGSRDTSYVSPVARRAVGSTWPDMQLQPDGSVLLSGSYVVPGEVGIRGLVRLFTGGPAISVQPANVAANAGGSATFSVTAIGPTPLSYQWRKDGVNIAGAASATYTIASVTPAHAGSYDVLVTSVSGTVTSNPATLVVNYVEIQTPPASQTVVAGQPVTFGVVASGVPTPTYQWKRNGSALLNATSASFSLSAVTAGDDGASFTVDVSNVAGTVTPPAAVLTVNYTPTVVVAPANQTVSAGQPASLAATVTGNPAATLQWRRNGVPVTGATDVVFTIAATVPADDASYDVVATNSIGSATSNSATLVVNYGPIITSSAADVVANLGGNATFSVTATAKPAPTYQWQRNGTPLAGKTNATLALTNLTAAEAGAYQVVVANTVGSVTFTAGTLSFNAGIASFSPTSANVGDTVTINGVGFTGAAAVKFNGTSAVSFTVVSDTQITAVVPTYATTGPIAITAAGGATLTSNGSLTILPGPRIAVGSILANVGTGENALLSSFTVEGTGSKSFLIRAVGPGLVPFGVTGALSDPQLTIHDGTGTVIAFNDNWGGATAIANAATAAGAFALTATSKDSALLVNLAPGTYTARVSGAGATTGEALLEIYETASAGRAVSLSTRARSTSSISTSFVLGGSGTSGNKTVLIRAVGAGLGTAGALANPTLTVLGGATTIGSNDNWGTASNQGDLAAATAAVGAMPLATNDAALLLTLPPGNYTVQAAGGTGLVMTEIFLVDGYRDAAFAPALLAPLQDQTLVAGSSVTMAAPFVGKPAAVGFQWKKNGNAIGGATNQSYTIANANATDAGDYTVAMTNSAGTTTTIAATLGVNTLPAITTQPVAQTVIVGQTATFTVAATGFPDPTYQWRRNGLNIAGATGAMLTLAGVTFDSGGSFDVVVSNFVGAVTSSSALLTVNPLAPSITSPLSATAVLGRTFSYQINAGTTQATYGATGLPAGLAVSTSTGVISGVPTVTGDFAVALTAQNGSGTNSKTLTLTVQPPPPIINSAASSSGRVGSEFSFTIQAVNGPTSFGAAELPGGLSLNTSTGQITGTPTQTGTFTVTLSATNGTGTTTSQLVLTIEPPLNAPVYSGTTLLSGVQNSAFNFTPTFNTSGLTTAYSATGLPGGVTINASTGAIGGTPTATGTFNVNVTATSSGGSATVAFTFTVNPPPSAPTITNVSLASGTVGSAFSFTLTANGTPASFAATGLPALGLSLNASTGAITGIPTASGTLTLQVSAANNVGNGAQAALVITINPSPSAPMIDSASALSGRVGEAFSTTLHANNSPTSFSVRSGTLPAGLSLAPATGAITGTPTQVGSFVVWFVASNSFGPGYALQVNFTIAPALTTPVVNSNGTAAGQVGQPFTYQITATNSPTSFAATGLPAGLSLNTTTGVISGIPSDATTTALSIALTARNADGISTPKTLLLTIAPAPATPVITSALAASAQVGTAFSYQTTASDNATSFVALGLPAGLSLNSTSGAISGTPTTSGSFNVTLRASNAAGLGAPSTLAVNIAPAPSAPAITSAAGASGKVGNSFTYSITATGSATNYGLTGTLPLGLSFNTSIGIISGSPAASGVFTVQLTATSAGGTSLPQTLVLNIAPADNAPVITSPIYASATVGQTFSYQITAASSPAFPAVPFPAPFTLDAINLPAGLGVNPSTGFVQGQPSAAGVFIATLVGANSAGMGPYRDLTIFIAPAPTAPTVTSSPYAAGQVGTGFSYTITGTNSPTSFDVLGAPAWMTINTTTGALAGNPTSPGTFTVQLVATNAAGAGTSLALTVTIAPSANAPVVTSTRTATGMVSASITYQITAAVPSGAPPVTSYVATGLPAGLSLNASTGAINGMPMQSGQFEVTLIARNSAGDSQPVTLILTINPSLQFNP